MCDKQKELDELLKRFHPGAEYMQEIRDLPIEQRIARLKVIEHMLLRLEAIRSEGKNTSSH